MSAHSLGVIALLLGALGFALLAVLSCARLLAARKSARVLDQAMVNRAAQASVQGAATLDARTAASRGPRGGATTSDAPIGVSSRSGVPGMIDALGAIGVGWLDTPLGKLIVADEDRSLLDQCGYADARARGLYCIVRLGCAFAFAALAAWYSIAHGARPVAWAGGGLLLGFFLPKLVVRRRAHARLDAVADELPMLVDLLRLLQGVGLSLDQSLQVMISEFRVVLPVLSGEVEIAQRQFVAGRTREQSLQRMASIYENEDLRAVIRLLVQVDKHGGAVQEPLKQFGDRLREVRRATLRERIGKLTVRMTGVMVVTLLPALLIVTAGPGVIAVLHSLALVRH
ncbi:type II secretion system F family protein [Paraburkholderia sacchari]|uniref:type II secretion system F family protein n=1 Tax=Paraburkholderia sacchari TaxID=159450 RepID=UPI001BCAFFE7|nr:type II secretion system F family protein [Paraburkholderia sacchari]